MKKKVLVIVLFIILIKFLFFFPANSEINKKVDLIKQEISKKGYSNYWFVISRKRFKWYNMILTNSVKNSNHLKGIAIDIYVFDINGDGIFNSKDIKIIEDANDLIELNHPELVGAFGTYISKGYFSRHMIHFDTSGVKIRYY